MYRGLGCTAATGSQGRSRQPPQPAYAARVRRPSAALWMPMQGIRHAKAPHDGARCRTPNTHKYWQGSARMRRWPARGSPKLAGPGPRTLAGRPSARHHYSPATPGLEPPPASPVIAFSASGAPGAAGDSAAGRSTDGPGGRRARAGRGPGSCRPSRAWWEESDDRRRLIATAMHIGHTRAGAEAAIRRGRNQERAHAGCRLSSDRRRSLLGSPRARRRHKATCRRSGS